MEARASDLGASSERRRGSCAARGRSGGKGRPISRRWTSDDHSGRQSGKVHGFQQGRNVQGRISIVVDHLETSLDCDSANFRADFVKIAKPPELSNIDLDGNFGCS
jgi:hypothetical protein